VYILAPRAGPEHRTSIELMTPKEALLELVQNSYMNWLLDREQRAREFEVLTQLVGQVRVWRVVASGDSRKIDELCQTILRSAGQFSLEPLAAGLLHLS